MTTWSWSGALAVMETEAWKELRGGDIRIEQTIYVERESQRKIVLGKGGQTIKSIGEAARFVHYGLTSSDVVDTANALLLRDACDLLLKKIESFLEVLKRRAFEFNNRLLTCTASTAEGSDNSGRRQNALRRNRI